MKTTDKPTELNLTFAANVTYSGVTYNTKIFVEYEHTGKQWITKKRGQKIETLTENPEIAQEWKNKGLKVKEFLGYYFIKRLAIPTINASGKPGKWYINNQGDDYRINKASKFWNKIHKELSKNEQLTPNQ